MAECNVCGKEFINKDKTASQGPVLTSVKVPVRNSTFINDAIMGSGDCCVVLAVEYINFFNTNCIPIQFLKLDV